MAESEYVYRTLIEEDETAVKQLVKSVFSRFLCGTYWEWKYARNPHFDPSMVAVAEKNGKIVGCNHWLLRDFKLSGSLKAKAILCADIAVDPDHRKSGVGRNLLLFPRSTDAFKKKGAVVNYMFADPELGKRFYGPVVGYVPIPTMTRTYTKRLNWRKVMDRIDEINERMESERKVDARIAEVDFRIAFRVDGAPPLTISINGERILGSEGNSPEADVKIRSDLATLISLQKRKNRRRNLVKALLSRKLKIRGNLFSMWRLHRNLDLLEEIFT